jgi:endonuclease/exonuclease/phosphatase family metal-dependent hydrolase
MLLVGALLTACAGQRALQPAPVRVLGANPVPSEAGSAAGGSFRVLTLNAAHSRGTGLHQILQSAEDARRNLASIGALLAREQPNVVALQELDGPSLWSGRFDHAEVLTDSSGLSSFLRADHERRVGLRYGTALLADRPLAAGEAFAFPSGPIWPAKGYTLASIRLDEPTARSVTLVSLHLDPLRPRVRREQLKLLAARLEHVDGPLVVMGDFNCEWSEAGCLPWFTGHLGLTAHAPGASDQFTFALTGRRLDWILVSPELGFAGYRVLEDPVSDHRAVIADLYWRIPRHGGASLAGAAATMPDAEWVFSP